MRSKIQWLLMALILLGGLARFYDLDAPWKRKGHYNYGGVHTAEFLECMKKIPLEVSKGVPYRFCTDNEISGGYPNHPPTLIFGMWAWSEIFGDGPAMQRSFVALFSLLNILLVFCLARALSFNQTMALFSAALQSLFPGSLLFATHNDFVCEFSVFFSLLAALLLLRGRAHWACVVTILAGVAAWPGFLGFAGIFGYQVIQKRKVWPVIVWGFAGACVGLSMMMWLHQTFSITEFLRQKMVHQGYVGHQELDYFYPLRWLYQAWQYHSSMLSPLFLFWLVLAGASLRWQRDRKLIAGILAISGGGFLNAILGHQFIYVHEFNYLYCLPAYALLISSWWQKQSESVSDPNHRWKTWSFSLLVLILISTYPYGRYQSSQTLDILNDLVMVLLVISFAWRYRRQNLNSKSWLLFLAVGGAVNISQLVNWRNEPALDFVYCQKARLQFQTTGTLPPTDLTDDFSLQYYCRGLPVTPKPE